MNQASKVSILVFPGSNCDRDLKVAIKNSLNLEPEMIWHKTSHIKRTNMILIPGGFSFGDHLRAGIIATKSPAVKELIRLASKGIPIVGICNGFQILTECNLLPGALLKNKIPKFLCKNINLKVKNTNKFTSFYKDNQIISLPIAHSQGNFYANQKTILELENNNQIVFKYSSDLGLIDNNYNPNGSKKNIAGIINKEGNILGLMPHPERAVSFNKNKDGSLFFKGLGDLL